MCMSTEGSGPCGANATIISIFQVDCKKQLLWVGKIDPSIICYIIL